MPLLHVQELLPCLATWMYCNLPTTRFHCFLKRVVLVARNRSERVVPVESSVQSTTRHLTSWLLTQFKGSRYAC